MPGLRYDVFFDSVRKKFPSEVGLKLHHANVTPMRHAITTEILPMATNRVSLAFASTYRLYTSIAVIVDNEFNIE